LRRRAAAKFAFSVAGLFLPREKQFGDFK